MRRIIQILLMLLFVLNASLASAAPPCAHCQDSDCPPAACLDMGCLPAGAMPALPVRAPAMLPSSGVAPEFPLVSLSLPIPLREVWSPPD